MKFNIFKAALVGFALTVSCGANAGLITETLEVFEKGERGDEQEHFNWTFDNLAPEISSISLKFEWGGMDFTDTQLGDTIEYFDIYAGNTKIGVIGDYDTTTSCNLANEYSPNPWESDCSGEKTFTLTDSSLWSSSSLYLRADNVNRTDRTGVQSNGVFDEGTPRGYIAAIISYEEPSAQTSVPEPSTLAIFALGIFGLASRRFKK